MSSIEEEFSTLAAQDIAAQMSADPDKYVNDSSCEVAWACKAAERASIHMNLLLGCNTLELKLNKQQEAIYAKFRDAFPDMTVENVTEADLKGTTKDKWFQFCEQFKELIEEYNLGTILRMRADGAYSEANTIIVPKIIFLAIEAARNKEGVNERAKLFYRQEHERVNKEGGNVC